MRLVLAIALALCAAPRRAPADPLRGLHLEGWYGKIGLETGVAFARDRGTAPLLGGVATLVRLNEHLEWYGVQGDLMVDWNGDRDAGARWSFGPEAGVSLYGVDVSYFGERIGGDTHHGMQVRAKLTAGIAAFYVRAAYVARGGDETSIDAGLQLKLPVWIRRDRRSLRDAARDAAIAAR